MFSTKDINKNHILTYLNYRKNPNMDISGKDILTEDDIDICDGRMYNDEHTVNIQPLTNKFIPFTLTETYYNDVVLHIASIKREDKINNIIKKET
jgi:hypothetical protein